MPQKKRQNPQKKKMMEDKVPHLLQRLITLNEQQTVKDSPDVPDVIWPSIKRHRIYTYVRKLDLGYLTPSVTVETDGAYTFSLSALPDSTEFTSLYDTYRITCVKVNFVPLFTDTSATVAYPPLMTAIDYDDASSTALTVLEEYDSALRSATGQFFTRTFTPKVAIAAYSGAFTSFGQRTWQWIDAASPSVIHYGLKYALPVAGAANQVWSVNADLILQFREFR
jgi:hypothetical protein